MTTSISSLLDKLNQLRQRLNQHTSEGIEDGGMLKKYSYFVRTSSLGRACTYSIKTKELFFLEDYEEIKELIEEVYQLLHETNR